jgi:Ser/Thr protein kinase RdoA (MazF antagonist)
METDGWVQPDTVARLVTADYDVGPVSVCRHLFTSVNHTYRLKAGNSCYAVRVHGRNKWWIGSDKELLFELDLLHHLHSHDVPVSYPIPTREGQPLSTIDTPAGPRRLVLFSWAPGRPGADTRSKSYRVGATVAAIDVVADSFQPSHPRHQMDLSTLLDRYLNRLGLDGQPASDIRSAYRHIREIRRRVASFDPGPTGWGGVHGDVQELNFHFDDENRITFLDFDLCGYGWRAYEVAYYYTRIPKHLRGSFMRGYESVRPLSPAEHEMLPTFGRLAWIREGCQANSLVYRMRKPYMSDAAFQ